MEHISRRSFVTIAGAACSAALMAGCGSKSSSTTSEQATSDPASTSSATTSTTIDYMVLVNKQHALPDGWEDAVQLVEHANSEGWSTEVEARAYEAYLALVDDLAAEGVDIDLDSAYRSVDAQKKVMAEFTEKYGEEYAKRVVATPGYSEHHTGLALDVFLIIDGKGVYENEDMEQHPDIWEKIHAKLADHGFILRYLPRRKIITGYSYEPWHLRFIDDADIAHQIMAADITFEEYLDEVDPAVAGCVVDYGNSKLYTDADIDGALGLLIDEFHGWTGCVMKRFAFAGDDACGADELAYVNEMRDEGVKEFDQAIVLVTDFHTPSAEQAEGTAWEPDTDVVGWTWHFGRTGSDGAWALISWGAA